MNLDAIEAGAELLGAVATVSIFAYLALQIRQNAKMAVVVVSTEHAEQRVQQSAFIVRSSKVIGLFWAGLDDSEALSRDEYRRFPRLGSHFRFDKMPLPGEESRMGLWSKGVLGAGSDRVLLGCRLPPVQRYGLGGLSAQLARDWRVQYSAS